MEPETKTRNNIGSHRIVLATKRDSSQKRPKKIGLLKKFLYWIARGTEKSGTGKPFCPT
ncbi:MAG: hypothetical protein JRE29_14480 [Deltaproteobacteria bacterium]|nr:hypothetical protein [Deltaproteobacteria bacterium]